MRSDGPTAAAALGHSETAPIVVFGSPLSRAGAEHDLVGDYRLVVFPVLLARLAPTARRVGRTSSGCYLIDRAALRELSRWTADRG